MRRVENPPNPYESAHREWLEEPPKAEVHIYEETARTILAKNDSPDIPFNWSVNPYRGCQHACAYCYARPYHEYLGYGAGTDFDTRIVVKINAAELLANELAHRKWNRECINFSGVTDCYQPIESVWNITRRCLEVCRDVANPVVIVTRSRLIIRDAELIADINDRAGSAVFVSIPFADDATARIIEPYAPPPSRRFDAIAKLTKAGVPVGVFVAPIIPGLNDNQIPAILEKASEAGARTAANTALRLPGSVEQVFLSRLRKAMPLRAERIENRIRDIRGGQLDDKRFGRRMTGQGNYWETIQKLFQIAARKAGLQTDTRRLIKIKPARRKSPQAQLTLGFD